MKKLYLFLILLCGQLSAQSDANSALVIMNALADRATIFSNLEAELDNRSNQYEIEKHRPIFVCGTCIIGTDVIDYQDLIITPQYFDRSKVSKGSISGEIVDSETGEDLLFASVALYQNDELIGGTETDLDGKFLLSDLDAGLYDVEVSYIGYRTLRIAAIEVEKEIIKPENKTEFNLKGKLLDAESKENLLFASLAVYQNGEFITGTESDFDGNYYIQNLSAGEYQLEASYIGYETTTKTIIIDKAINFDLELKERINEIPVQHWGCIKYPLIEPTAPGLKVIDKTSKEPLIGVHVSFQKDNQFVDGSTTDFDGRLAMKGLSDTNYQVKLSYIGYEEIDTILHYNPKSVTQIEMKPSNNILCEVIIVGYKTYGKGCYTTCGGTITTNVCYGKDRDNNNEEDDLALKVIEAPNNKLEFFPNPASDLLTINVKENTSSLFISTQTGQVIFELKNPSVGLNKIALAEFPSGNYFVSVVGKNEIRTENLIIAK